MMMHSYMVGQLATLCFIISCSPATHEPEVAEMLEASESQTNSVGPTPGYIHHGHWLAAFWGHRHVFYVDWAMTPMGPTSIEDENPDMAPEEVNIYRVSPDVFCCMFGLLM